jgi:hypothetical protein
MRYLGCGDVAEELERTDSVLITGDDAANRIDVDSGCRGGRSLKRRAL